MDCVEANCDLTAVRKNGPNDIFSFYRERQGFWVILAKQETQENQ